MSSVCSSRITSALTTFSPASIIVANWREKIWSDFGLTFLKTVRALSSPLAGSSIRSSGKQAAQAQLLAGGLEVGRVELALGFDSRSVDRLVCEGGHPDSVSAEGSDLLSPGRGLPIDGL